MTHLDEPLTRILGARSARPLATLGIETVGDLLGHYPRRYQDLGELTPLGRLPVGEHVTVVARVAKVTEVPLRNRPGSMQKVTVTDGETELMLTFFGKAYGRTHVLRPGRVFLFSGTVETFRQQRQLTHPAFEPIDADPGDAEQVAEHARRLMPIYPATAKVTSQVIDRAMRLVLDTLGEVPDPLPDEVRERQRLLDRRSALLAIHRPDDRPAAALARARLRFDEAFVLQVVLAQRRRELRALPATARVHAAGGLLGEFDAGLPFALTDGQRAVGEQIERDLARTHPMHRLLQGEVGSGKTVVALRAMLAVVDAGGQAALLAPTEVLAHQHHRTLTAMLGPLADRGRLGGSERGTRVALLTGSQGTARRRAELLDVVSGDAGIVVGTHALLQEAVTFHDLALVVVDEQHRFGVEQRAVLADKARDGTRPHVLVMTATPIPRTVAMTVFGDLDVSSLTELPAGRSGVTTHVVAAAERPAHVARIWQRIGEEVALGHKAYVVFPRIGDPPGEAGPAVPGDDDDAAGDVAGAGGHDPGGEPAGPGSRPPLALLEQLPHLLDGPLDSLRVGVLHGRLPVDEKDEAMRRFGLAAEDPDALDVLAATTVIEVGVDVPAATVMVVMDAERFGLSQLHQLRGRVGRGQAPGLCLLVTDAEAGSPARERLDAVAATTDGFELSDLDLRLRREGDVLGASQSGRRSSLRLLEVVKHEAVIAAAREEAEAAVAADPDLAGNVALRREVERIVAARQAEFLDKT